MRKILLTLAVLTAVVATAVPVASAYPAGQYHQLKLGELVYPANMKFACMYKKLPDGKQLVCIGGPDNSNVTVYIMAGGVEIYTGNREVFSKGWGRSNSF